MKSIVICGSRRFKSEIKEFSKKLKELGVVVFEYYIHSDHEEWENLSDAYKRFVILGHAHDHFYKIKMADVVFVYNKDGYIGNSTTLEIGYAVAVNKPIYALSDGDNEISRHVLFRDFFSSPEDFLKVLK